MASFEIRQRIDLERDNPIMEYSSPLTYGSQNGHTWKAYVFLDDEPYDLYGHGVIGYFNRADGLVVPVTGSVQGNVASVILDQKCYAIPGRLSCVLTITKGASTVGVAVLQARVTGNLSGQFIDPGQIIPPDVTDLFNSISAMNAATAQAIAAAGVVEPWKNAVADAETVAYGSGAGVSVSVVKDKIQFIFKVPAGKDGADGRSFQVLGVYDTFGDLIAAHPSGISGEAYMVGKPGANTVFLWDDVKKSWQDIGKIEGPPGPPGPKGDQGAPFDSAEIIKKLGDLDHDKLGVQRVAIKGDALTQAEAAEVLGNPTFYEGQIIEFLTNGDMPNKAVAYGFIVSDKTGNTFLLTFDLAGNARQWNKQDYRSCSVGYRLNEGQIDCDSLTADNIGDPAQYVAGLENAFNKPPNTSSKGALMILPYDLQEQIQIYLDTADGKLYRRTVKGTDGRHSFGTWEAAGGGIAEIPVAAADKVGGAKAKTAGPGDTQPVTIDPVTGEFRVPEKSKDSKKLGGQLPEYYAGVEKFKVEGLDQSITDVHPNLNAVFHLKAGGQVVEFTASIECKTQVPARETLFKIPEYLSPHGSLETPLLYYDFNGGCVIDYTGKCFSYSDLPTGWFKINVTYLRDGGV